MPDYSSASFHPGCFGRALEQALALCRLVRAQIGVAGLVAYRGDHTGAARDFGGRFFCAAFETTVETKSCPGFGKLSSTPTIWHSVYPSTLVRLATSAQVPGFGLVERCNAAVFSTTMRLYSAEVQVFWAIIKVRRAIVSHDATIISVMIKGSARLRRWMDLRIVSAQVAGGPAVSRCLRIALDRAPARAARWSRPTSGGDLERPRAGSVPRRCLPHRIGRIRAQSSCSDHT